MPAPPEPPAYIRFSHPITSVAQSARGQKAQKSWASAQITMGTREQQPWTENHHDDRRQHRPSRASGEKSADADLLREMIGFAAERLVEPMAPGRYLG